MITQRRYVTAADGRLLESPNNEAVFKVKVWGMESRHKILLQAFLDQHTPELLQSFIDGGSANQVGIVNVETIHSDKGGEMRANQLLEKLTAWVFSYEHNLRRRVVYECSDMTLGLALKRKAFQHDGVLIEVQRAQVDNLVVAGDWDDKREVVRLVSEKIKSLR